MNDAKHSPGPWKWVAMGDYHILEDADGNRIADDGSACGEYGGWMDQPEDPNARLFAVAPELLEFAEEVRRTGDSRLASMAIALIAKATGGQL